MTNHKFNRDIKYSLLTDILVWLVVLSCLVLIVFITVTQDIQDEKVKDSFQVLAYFAASFFIVIKIITGQFNSGMETSIVTSRIQTADPNIDYLAIQLQLKRNNTGRLVIEEAEILLKKLKRRKKTKVLKGQELIRDKNIIEGKIDQISENGISLPPGDSTEIAFFGEVDHGAAILIEATIVGHRTGQFWAYPQWRVSAISLPV